MILGVLQLELHIRGAESIKDKRRVVNSVKDKLHREHQVSVAEVASQDNMSVARLGVALVATDGRRAGEVLDAIMEKMRGLLEAELASSTRKVLQFKDLPESEEAGPDADEIAGELLRYFDSPDDAPDKGDLNP
jgi:uncharacterized protein YlxP (DUF503 family)